MAHHEKALHLQFQLLILNRDKGENILILSYQLPLEKKMLPCRKNGTLWDVHLERSKEPPLHT